MVVIALVVFSDGFESGDFSAWTANGGVRAVVNHDFHHGGFAAEFSGAADDYCYKEFAAVGKAYLRFYVKFVSLLSGGDGSNDTIAASVGDGVPNQVFVDVYNDGGVIKFSLRAGGVQHITDVPVALDTWYCIELMVDPDGVNISSELWINGVSKATDVLPSTETEVTIFYVGYWNKSEALTNYVDCCVIDVSRISCESDMAAAVSGSSGGGLHHGGDKRYKDARVINGWKLKS